MRSLALLFALSCAVAVTTSLVIADASSSSATIGPIGDWERVRSTTSSHTTSGQRDVLCPAGKKALGGGYHIVGGGQSLGFGSEGFYVTINRPTDDAGGWRVAWYADVDVKKFYVQLFAICATA